MLEVAPLKILRASTSLADIIPRLIRTTTPSISQSLQTSTMLRSTLGRSSTLCIPPSTRMPSSSTSLGTAALKKQLPRQEAPPQEAPEDIDLSEFSPCQHFRVEDLDRLQEINERRWAREFARLPWYKKARARMYERFLRTFW
ncbi:hypothetical protein G7046_g4737 [Stylonectria norvegica]|nr:hypothetical protein G7046_g4737 [Stylonectria norvegica]